jgi:6-phosphogluconolactonase (cycloisomerase 2 family)
MSKRFAWLLGAAVVFLGFLMACGSNYNGTSDGLVVVGSQGSALLQTFSFSLASGGVSAISNPVSDTANQTCVLPGNPSTIVLDPAGAYAYVILSAVSDCSNSQTGIEAFKVNSDGTITPTGTVVADPNPTALAIDSAGKYLFVAEGLSTTAVNNYEASPSTYTCAQTNGPPPTPVQYGVCVYAIGSGGALTEVPPTFSFPNPPPLNMAPNFSALAVSPTVFPAVVNGKPVAVCSTTTPPTTEYVYATDSNNNVVWQFGVNASSGALENPSTFGNAQFFPAVSVPQGVAVDPCNRFVYVSNNRSNQINAYSICSNISLPNCPIANGSLVTVPGSPFSNSGAATYPGPLVVDAFGNFLYVLDQGSNMISPFRISPVSGAIQPLTPATVATGLGAKSIAIRSDDSWLFVTNNLAATLSQYSVTPASGALTPVPVTQTDNEPWGVAVK